MSDTKQDDGEFIAEGPLEVKIDDNDEDHVWEFQYLPKEGIDFITTVDTVVDDPLHMKPVLHEGALMGGSNTQWILNCIAEEIEEKHKVPKIELVGQGLVIIRDSTTSCAKAFYYLHPSKDEGGEPFWVHILPTVETKNTEETKEETPTSIEEECEKPDVFEPPRSTE